MEIKIGDRFISVDNTSGTWEVTKIQPQVYFCKRLEDNLEDIWFHLDDLRQWKFLGNFSKAKNFNNLYSILNEEAPN